MAKLNIQTPSPTLLSINWTLNEKDVKNMSLHKVAREISRRYFDSKYSKTIYGVLERLKNETHSYLIARDIYNGVMLKQKIYKENP